MNGDAVSGLITIIAMLTIIITFVIKERNSEAHKRLKEFKFSEENKNLECKEYEKENILDELRLENGELTVELSEIKNRILTEKGYIGEFITFYGVNALVSVRYDYYVNELDDLKVERKSDGFKEVFELDQKGEIFPNRELAEKNLLEKIKEQEQVKQELIEKYADKEDGDKKENVKISDKGRTHKQVKDKFVKM